MKKYLTAVFAIVTAAGLAVACARTDAGITTSVKTRLAADDTVRAYQIDVDTKENVVTLSGEVDSHAAKEQAVMIARETEGVRDVVDNIIVAEGAAAMPREYPTAPTTGEARPGELGARLDDAAITAAVKAKLLADTSVSGLRIDVDTRGGVVTLTGEVESEAARAAAIRIARETEGVTNVEDRLTIRSR
jgi:hyperosmotically inducible protein